jgi:hypothetical protein
MWSLATHQNTSDTREITYVGREPPNFKLLRALEKTRGKWDNDKQFAKIAQKIRKGKSLKSKEFDKVDFYLRKYSQPY